MHYLGLPRCISLRTRMSALNLLSNILTEHPIDSTAEKRKVIILTYQSISDTIDCVNCGFIIGIVANCTFVGDNNIVAIHTVLLMLIIPVASNVASN